MLLPIYGAAEAVVVAMTVTLAAQVEAADSVELHFLCSLVKLLPWL
jgi:hypothetical protein